MVAIAQDRESALSATIRFSRVRSLPAIIARLRNMADLAADPERIDAHLSEDPLLAPLVAARPGVRVPGSWDGFEMLVRAAIGQRSGPHGASCLMQRLVMAHGDLLEDPQAALDGLTHLFPVPERLAGADLTAIGLPRTLATTLSSLASAIAADPLAFAPRPSLQAAVDRFSALPGIAEWSAQVIAMHQLREPDAFPAADPGLLQTMRRVDGHHYTLARFLARAERWRPWRAYAAAHLLALGAAREGERRGKGVSAGGKVNESSALHPVWAAR
jgi:AraC family transcriptional regulator of adaptative response / DNA-3-methyladenine glycosylase II